jgi:hypothetical protein
MKEKLDSFDHVLPGIEMHGLGGPDQFNLQAHQTTHRVLFCRLSVTLLYEEMTAFQ